VAGEVTMPHARFVIAVSLLAAAATAQEPAPAPNTAIVPEARDGDHRERHERINALVRARAGDVDLVFIGDSITQSWEGDGQAIWAERYGPRKAINLGISGDRTEHVLWRLDHGNLDGIAPKVAVVMIGTNNFGHETHTPAQILEGVRAVVAKIRAKSPSTKVLLLDIFPRGERFNAMRGGILQVNQALAWLHDGERVFFLPIGARFVQPDGSISKAVMPDALHLSTEGYRRWADAIEPTLVRLLGETPAGDKGNADPWVVFEGGSGPGAGKHIVFVTGDEEYRSEECMPQLAKILAIRHGFRCTVLFSIDPDSGAIDPTRNDNIPGLQALDRADLMVIFTRFRDLPDEQMAHIVAYVDSGRPVIGLRTATHAFAFKKHKTHARYGWNDAGWPGGFGKQVLGETWVAHWGAHDSQSARGVTAPGMADHPILRGIAPNTIWDPADVYTVRLPLEGSEPLVLGQVLEGMSPSDPPAAEKNDPMMPLAWTRTFESASGKRARVFTTTLGSAPAFAHEGSRRLLVNACYWALGMEDAIPARSDVGLVGDYEPSDFGFGGHRNGVRPADHRLPHR
jgi:lysophospholipase L1-like esterase